MLLARARAALRPLLRTLPVVLGAGCFLGACDASVTTDAVQVADSAGVRLVRNLRPAADTLVLNTPTAVIGGEDDARYAFQYVQGLTPLRDGSVIVVDRAPRVALFSADGQWIRDLGREGAGPGEYRVPAWALARGDTVTIYDMGQQRLASLTLEGEPLAMQRIDPPGFGFHARPFADGWLDKRERGQYREPGPARAYLVRRAPSGAMRDTVLGPYAVPRIGWRITDPATGSGMMENPPALSLDPPWTIIAGNQFAWTAGVEPRIEIRDSAGVLVRIVELPLLPRDVAEDDRNAYLTAMADRFGMDAAARERLRTGIVFEQRMPLIARLLADDTGRLWAASFDPAVPLGGVGARWDVLRADGGLERHVVFPPGFELHAVRDSRAYGVRTDDLGVQAVQVFALL